MFGRENNLTPMPFLARDREKSVLCSGSSPGRVGACVVLVGRMDGRRLPGVSKPDGTGQGVAPWSAVSALAGSQDRRDGTCWPVRPAAMSVLGGGRVAAVRAVWRPSAGMLRGACLEVVGVWNGCLLLGWSAAAVTAPPSAAPRRVPGASVARCQPVPRSTPRTSRATGAAGRGDGPGNAARLSRSACGP